MTTRAHSEGGLVGVALIGADDQTAFAIVERLLNAAEIKCFVEGSVVYSVQVPRSDLVRAKDILKASSELKKHWIQFPPE
jgi:hypothetical protein